jgi:hypothetical protein
VDEALSDADDAAVLAAVAGNANDASSRAVGTTSEVFKKCMAAR